MAESRIPLLENRIALANASGVTTIEVTTISPHEYWEVTNTVISTRTVGANAPDVAPEFRLYRDTPANSGLIDISFNGSDDVSDTVYQVYPGRRLIGIWTGMVAGNEATLLLQGTRVIRGDRGY